MHIKIPSLAQLAFLLILPLLAACEAMSLAPIPTQTPQVVVVTGVPTNTPIPSPTPPFTRTPVATPTPISSPTPTPYPCTEEGGQMIPFDDFQSAVAGENLRYRVYIPPCYLETQKRFPYVILLHGMNSNELQWDEIGLDEALDQGIRLGSLPPMIVVMPYTGRIGNDNTFPPEPSYETVIMDELLPAIERDFCTWNDRDHRALGGISRGGFWAYSVGLRYPDVFGILGGHSATFDRDHAPPEFNPLDLALNAAFLDDTSMRMYLDNGASDPAGTNLQLFSSRLSSRGIAHTYVINPVGGHDEDYWTQHVEEYLSFYGRDWTRNMNELPSCLEPSP